MQLRDLISIEYEKKARNKPNGVILNHINLLHRFLALLCRNINEKQRTFHFRFSKSSMLSMTYENFAPDFRENIDQVPPDVSTNLSRQRPEATHSFLRRCPFRMRDEL